jgi:formate hydrogenlyase subunit 3/multisubunit Na+/H+ antiporter MnhD subunit
VPWLLLETRLAVDPTGRVFLMFTSLLWFLSGHYACSYLTSDPHRGRFFLFFQLSMAGNLGLIISQDVISFYVFFALMSFASYGLVIHTGKAKALKAGRIYMILVVIGEILIFTAFLLLAASVDSLLLKDFANARPGNPTVFLILLGFGIKAGALPLHVWLPLAHPAAPTPASAVLSGAMIKAGLLGWLRFLPIGLIAMPEWGTLFIVAGLAAAYYGVVVGVTQQNPKTVLAYSSISQMGLMTVGVGLALRWPQTAPLVLPAITVYAFHHGLAKGALFLGVGVTSGAKGNAPAYFFSVAGLVLSSISLAGAPFTSGAVAKIALKLPLQEVSHIWGSGAGLSLLLLLAAVGTTVLMARFLFVITGQSSDHGDLRTGVWSPWALAVLLSTAAIWILPEARQAAVKSIEGVSLWQALWPVLTGIGLAACVWLLSVRKKWRLPIGIPEGDLLQIVFGLQRIRPRMVSTGSSRFRDCLSWIDRARHDLQNRRPIRKRPRHVENWLMKWQTAGCIFLFLIGLLFIFSRNL